MIDWQLPNKKYDIVLSDPPWEYYGQQDKMGAAAKFYETVPDEDLLRLPMRQIMHSRSILFMWATSPRLHFAFKCLEAWKLDYRGVAFVWVKTKKNGEPIGAQGVRPSIIKPTTEYVIAASFLEKGRPLRLSDEAARQLLQTDEVFNPKQEHSRKPDEIHRRIEKMYPHYTKLEMFARRPVEGWDNWGNEIPIENPIVKPWWPVKEA